MADSQLRQACAHPLPQPSDAELRDAMSLIARYLHEDYARLPDAPVGATATRSEMEALLREPAPELGTPFAQVFDQIKTRIAPYSLRPQHPRFLAFIPGAPTFVSVLGDWLCAGLNFFAGVWKEAPAAAQIEILVLDWFKEFLRLPQEALGVLTGGGSEANLLALVTARASRSRAERPRLIAYVCAQRHFSIDRAFLVMDLDPERIRPVAIDETGRLCPADLERLIAEDRSLGNVPWLVVANAGSTNRGVVDPLDEIAEVCTRHSLWFHVDAAYGWPAVLTPQGKELLKGIERADSLTLDPHKWFAQTFEAGCVLIREGHRLPAAFQMRAEYMQDVVPGEGEINFCDHGIALTRRFRALKIWFSIKVLGVAWFRRLVEHCRALAEYAAERIRALPGYEIVSEPSLSILCFRRVPAGASAQETNDANLRICESVRETGQAFLSTTQLGAIVCLRLCFVNYRTTADDVDIVVQLLMDVG